MKSKLPIAFILTLTLTIVVSIANAANTWGTYNPNLYFALKEKTTTGDTFGLAWAVKDWRTDTIIIRHAYQYAQP